MGLGLSGGGIGFAVQGRLGFGIWIRDSRRQLTCQPALGAQRVAGSVINATQP